MLVSEYVVTVDTKALIKIDGEAACIRIWLIFLAILRSINWDGNESADSCFTSANSGQLVNAETLQIIVATGGCLVTERCGVHVRVCGRGLV